LCCADWADQHNAELLLRIEDIDHIRCKSEYADAIIEDLHWLGLNWQQPIRYQSQCSSAYQQAMLKLRDMQVIYPCFCSRKEIREEIARMASAPHAEDGDSEYPGICRGLSADEQMQRMQDEPFAWRVHVNKALAMVGDDLSWQEVSGQKHAVHINSDVVIGRKDIAFSYHLAVVLDDAEQGITHIIRGHDLQDSTGVHRLLQALLDLSEPVYMHHPLLCGSDGERISKRNGGMSLHSLRQMGVDAQQLCAFLRGSEHLCWPFSQADEYQILTMLGKRD